MRIKILSCCLIVIGCGYLVFADYTQESWDIPLALNRNWSYFDMDAPPPHDADMQWFNSGGVGNSGHVRTPLARLDSMHNNQAYWPAYLYREIGVNQEIDLTVLNATVKIYALDAGLISPINFTGGKLYMFIGQWLHNGPEPEDDTWAFFYNLVPITINTDKWLVESSIPVGTNKNWGVIARNDPAVNPEDLFYHPQQWGFVIFGALDTPSGVLAMDSFRIVPEPAALTLLMLGGMIMAGSKRTQLPPPNQAR
jgi:hypothetical protein